MTDAQERVLNGLRYCIDKDECSSDCPLYGICDYGIVASVAETILDQFAPLVSELDSVRHERDSAVRDIHCMLRSHVGDGHPCLYCKHSNGSSFPLCEYVNSDICPKGEWIGCNNQEWNPDD